MILGYYTRVISLIISIICLVAIVGVTVMEGVPRICMVVANPVILYETHADAIFLVTLSAGLIIGGAGNYSLDGFLLRKTSINDDQVLPIKHDSGWLPLLLRAGFGLTFLLFVTDLLVNQVISPQYEGFYKSSLPVYGVAPERLVDLVFITASVLIVAGIIMRLGILLIFALKVFLAYQGINHGFFWNDIAPLADLILTVTLLIVLFLTGPGRYSLDRWLAGKRAQRAGG